MKSRWKLNVVALGMALGICSGLHAEIRYTVVDLGNIGGSNIVATDINNRGDVAGYGQNGSGIYHNFVYSNGVMSDLGSYGGNLGFDPAGINDNGDVASSTLVQGNSKAVRYSHGTTTDLGTLGSTRSHAEGINLSGQVTGYSTVQVVSGSFPQHAFLYSGTSMKDLGTLGGTNSGGADINDSGAITGWSSLANGKVHAFIYSNNTMTDLGTPSGYNGSEGKRINNLGQVAGLASKSDFSGRTTETRAFLYSNDTMVDMGTLGGSSLALGINDGGQATGWSNIDATNTLRHAFLYSDGTMTDLNSLIDPALGWTLGGASGINNDGLITGWGLNSSGHPVAFLLMPIPEPETLTILMLGGAALVVRGIRKRSTTV